MQHIVTPLMPFPNISWWLLAHESDELIFDYAEHFEKMSYRNRYYITGANGLIQLTIPLKHGRNQRTPMQDVIIDNKDDWQVQHWRTIASVYGNAPYFEHYAPSLERLMCTPFTHLTVFNMASIEWLRRHTGIEYEERVATSYKQYTHNSIADIRSSMKPGIEQKPLAEEMYYQVFTERNGFYPNLSLLDLLFAEGPMAKSILKQHKKTIMSWLK